MTVSVYTVYTICLSFTVIYFLKIMRKGALDYISHIRTLAGRTRNAVLLLPYFLLFYSSLIGCHVFRVFECFFILGKASVSLPPSLWRGASRNGVEWLSGQIPTGNFDSTSRCASWPIRCPEINQAEAQTDCCSRCWANAATHW